MDKKEKNISEVQSKLAEELAGENLEKDNYHACITQAARVLVDAGKGLYRYSTQWASGRTCWTFDGKSITVTRDGMIQ